MSQRRYRNLKAGYHSFSLLLILKSTSISSILWSLRARRGKSTFRPVRREAPHRLGGGFAPPELPGPPQVTEIKGSGKHISIKEYFPEAGFDVLQAACGRD